MAGNYLIHSNSSMILKLSVYYGHLSIERKYRKDAAWAAAKLLKVTRLYLVQGQYEFKFSRLLKCNWRDYAISGYSTNSPLYRCTKWRNLLKNHVNNTYFHPSFNTLDYSCNMVSFCFVVKINSCVVHVIARQINLIVFSLALDHPDGECAQYTKAICTWFKYSSHRMH